MPAGEPIAVLGDGKLGLSIAMVPNAHGYQVHQFGRHAAKLAIAARVGVQTEVVADVSTAVAAIIVNGITLIGSRCGRFAAALPLLGHLLVRVEELIAARFPLAEAPQAFARVAERGAENAVGVAARLFRLFAETVG
jgi:hypothetical protein